MAGAGDAGVSRERLKIFVSYSRADIGFADELVAGLNYDGGFEVAIDRSDIRAGEEWNARLAALIAGADTIVYLLSPNSVASPICRWEVEEAVKLSKRVLPVLVAPVENEAVPPQLAALNYVRFDGARSFMMALSELRQALNTDLAWLREHTRLLDRAREWNTAGRIANRMLTGTDISTAKAWLQNRPKMAPEPTDLHRDFILASELAEAERMSVEQKRLEDMAAAQAARAEALADRETAVKKLSRRTTLGLATAGTLTTLASGLAYWGVNAESRFRQEQELRKKAAEQALEQAIRKAAERTDIKGQIVAYAASPGQLAQDGPFGGNSPYTSYILTTMSNPDMSVQAALAETNAEVVRSSGGGQRPFYATDMNGDLYLLRQPKSRKRKALVVSVDRYRETVFANVERDAIAWEGFLSRCGFEVKRLVNPTLTEWQHALANLPFNRTQRDGALSPLLHRAAIGKGMVPIEGGDNTLVAFYLSGIGVYANGRNYLAPIDADAKSPESVAQTCLDLVTLNANLRSAAAASISILDTGFDAVFERNR